MKAIYEMSVFSPFLLSISEEKKKILSALGKKHDQTGQLLCLSGTDTNTWTGLYRNTYTVTKTSNSNTPELWGSLYIHSIFVAWAHL